MVTTAGKSPQSPGTGRGLFLVGTETLGEGRCLERDTLEVLREAARSLEIWVLGDRQAELGPLHAAGIDARFARLPAGSLSPGEGTGVGEVLRELARLRALRLDRSFLVATCPEVLRDGEDSGVTGVLIWDGRGPDQRARRGEGVVVLARLADAMPTFREGPLEGEGDPIRSAAWRIRHGQVVAFPTETVYGLGANALDPRAVARIFEVKRRPFFDPLIVHVAHRSWLDRLAREVPPEVWRLTDRFWPGPLTVVLPKTPLVPDLVTAGLDTVGIRMPDHPVARGLIEAAGVPLAAPSANPFGYVSPTRAEHVVEQLGDAVPCVLDGGPCGVGIESTIVAFEQGRPWLLRPGAVTLEDLQETLGLDLMRPPSGGTPMAPGMLPRHYSPRVSVHLFQGDIPAPPSPRAGLLLIRPRPVPAGYDRVEVLSRDGDLHEVAQRLFQALRDLDRGGLEVMLAEMPPEQGIGLAIADRLRRAASRS